MVYVQSTCVPIFDTFGKQEWTRARDTYKIDLRGMSGATSLQVCMSPQKYLNLISINFFCIARLQNSSGSHFDSDQASCEQVNSDDESYCAEQ